MNETAIIIWIAYSLGRGVNLGKQNWEELIIGIGNRSQRYVKSNRNFAFPVFCIIIAWTL